MRNLRLLLTLWLALAAIGVSAQTSITRAPSEDYTYTYKGVKYTYISANNWKAYFDQNMHTPTTYGWYENEDGWYVDSYGNYLTAASIDEQSVPENGEVYILNDLVGFFTNHTHLACIADNGFTGESKVKRIYFQDADAQTYNANSAFQFFIGHKAFANAPNLEKIDMMQYTTKGTNHWEAMPEYRVRHDPCGSLYTYRLSEQQRVGQTPESYHQLRAFRL